MTNRSFRGRGESEIGVKGITARVAEWNLTRVIHQGQRSRSTAQQAGHTTAPDRLPEHRKNPCNTGAIHTRPLAVNRGRSGGGPGKPSMKSGVGLAAKVVRAISHALFPDAEPQCRTGTHPVPPSASGRKDGFRALPKRSRGRQFNRHSCRSPSAPARRSSQYLNMSVPEPRYLPA